MAAEKRAAAAKTANRMESPSVALIHGDDEFRVAARARECLDRFLPEAERALGLDLVDGQADTIAEAVQSIRQTLNAVAGLGLFVSRKAVWLRDATFLNLGDPGRSRDVKDCLAELGQCIRQGLPEGFFLLITATDVDRRTEFFKICETAAMIEDYDLPTIWQRDRSALATVQACFREHRLEAGHEGVLEAIVEKTGTGTRQLRQEVGKLDVYLGDRRRVTLEDVAAVISPAREMIHWQLSDAVGERDLPKALDILRQLLAQKESSIGLLFGMESLFRLLAQLRELLDRRAIANPGGGRGSVDWSGLGDELRKRLELAAGDKAQQNPLKLHPFVAAKRVQQAAGFTRIEIRRAQEALVKAHQQVVSGDLPDPLVMEFLVIRLCVKPPRR